MTKAMEVLFYTVSVCISFLTLAFIAEKIKRYSRRRRVRYMDIESDIESLVRAQDRLGDRFETLEKKVDTIIANSTLKQ